jgi:DNA-binding transcriptional MerR regulator
MPEPEILAFSIEQVTKLTGLSERQLRYWDDTAFFVPEYALRRRGTRVYSFRDLVGLYTLARLRKEHRFSLQQLRPIGEYLGQHHTTPWASLGFYVQPQLRSVVFRRPDARDPERAFSALRPVGQEFIPFEMERIAEDVRERVRELRRRRPDQLGRVEQARRVVRNAPVLAGTRVPTAAIRSFHEAGYSEEQILREFPTLTREDVRAAIAYEANPPQRKNKKAAG